MTTAAAVGQSPPRHAENLPELRQELRLIGRSTDVDGEHQWTIYDPAQHRFIALDRKSYAMIESWGHGRTPADIVAAAWERHAELVGPEDVASLAEMLLRSGLAVPADPAMRLKALRNAAARKQGLGSALLHGYLFFRVPLFNPEPVLRWLLPIARPFAKRSTAVVVTALGVTGLALASREWDTLARDLGQLATLHGAMWLALALLVAKILHEFGHALAAAHFGCRVPTLGVAFILGAPLLYVDVTDAWKLQSARARTIINAAGVLVDLSVAAISLFLWVFLPPGSMKDIALAFATTAWLLSLTINLNPFMKFDGYHIVADLVGAANLQDRALAMAQWSMRETMFAFRADPPELCAPRTRRALAMFGAATWAYRVVLFTAIAMAVYQYFFKVLGILLFVVEIAYFIILPVFRELKVWVSRRSAIRRSRRSLVTAAMAGFLLVVVMVPWSSKVYVPAVLEPTSISHVHVQSPARLVTASLTAGDTVAVGDQLALLMSPELLHRRDVVRLKLALVETRLSRIAGEPADREAAVVLQREWAALREQQSGLDKQIDTLRISAPESGRIAMVASYLKPGRWVTTAEPLSVIHTGQKWEIRGLVDGTDLSRVRRGQSAIFVPDDLASPSVRASIGQVSEANSLFIEQIELASIYGGRIETRLTEDSQPKPVAPHYAIRAIPVPDLNLPGEAMSSPRVGVLVVAADARSLLSRLWNRVIQVLIRESGF